MKNSRISAFSALLFLLLYGMASYSQQLSPPSEENMASFQVFDKIVGPENTGIFNGIEYIERQRMINEKQKFFNSSDFQSATVFYEGQPYYNIPLKYNVPEDLVVVRLESGRGSNIFQLYNDKLEGFVVGNRQFINIPEQDRMPLQGIYEVLMKSSQQKLLKKHHMKSKKILSGKLLHYEFEADEPEYYYVVNDIAIEMDRNSLLKNFPDSRKDIRNYYRSQRKRSKVDPDSFIKGLFQVLNDLPE